MWDFMIYIEQYPNKQYNIDNISTKNCGRQKKLTNFKEDWEKTILSHINKKKNL